MAFTNGCGTFLEFGDIAKKDRCYNADKIKMAVDEAATSLKFARTGRPRAPGLAHDREDDSARSFRPLELRHTCTASGNAARANSSP